MLKTAYARRIYSSVERAMAKERMTAGEKIAVVLACFLLIGDKLSKKAARALKSISGEDILSCVGHFALGMLIAFLVWGVASYVDVVLSNGLHSTHMTSAWNMFTLALSNMH